MINEQAITAALKSHQDEYHPVVLFDQKKQKIAALDLSANNKDFTASIFNDLTLFSSFIQDRLRSKKATFLVGGYNERREMYSRSVLFDRDLSASEYSDEPRTLHLGMDIWGEAGTKVFAPLGGMIHSFAFNNNDGDYGATIILQHQLDSKNFYTLYGHLSENDLGNIRPGQFISRGEPFAHFGTPAENGNWPPHLHFQVILDMGVFEGDYPGVCKYSEAKKWLGNSPDPDLILNLDRYVTRSR